MANFILYVFLGFVVALILSAIVRTNAFLVCVISYSIAWIAAIFLSISKNKGD